MFRAPDHSKAKHRRATGGWDTPSQKEKVSSWFAEKGLVQPDTPAECWEVITGTLLRNLTDLTDTQDNP